MEHAIVNKWFREALEGSNVVSFVTDADLRYIAVINPLVLGDESHFLGRTPREVYAGLPECFELCDAYDQALISGDTHKSQVYVEGMWFEVTVRPTQLPDGSRGVIGIATDITHQRIILREQAHRTKNAFSIALAIARASAKGLDVPLEFQNKLHARLDALSKSQDAVSRGGSTHTTFHALIESQMGHAITEDPSRFEISESDCHIGADLALYVTLAIYELYTNAVKYGSLSNETGKVKIDCTTRNDLLHIVWTETGGPTPDPTTDNGNGFGRTLVTSLVPKSVRGEASFNLGPNGLVWALTAPQCPIAGCA